MAYGELVSEVKSQPAEEFKVYKYRYVIGVVYTLISIQNILMWLIFGPMQSNLKAVYGQSVFVINLGTILISNISYIPANFVATYLIDTYGLRFGTILGGILTTIGLWIRLFCEDGFQYIFIGQCFAGVAQPFFYSTPQKISNVWFGVNERTIATTAIAVSLNIGNALSAFIPQFFVDLNETDPTIFLPQLRHLMLCMAIAGSAFLVLTIVLFKKEPPTPPSRGAGASKLDYWGSLKTLCKDYNAMVFIIASAASAGGMVTYMSVLQELAAPYGINGVQVGNILLIGILIGFTGAAAAGIYVTKTKKFRNSVIFFTFIAFLAMIGNYFAVKSGNVYVFGVAFCVYVFFITPVMPLGLETGVEYSFPVAEATSGGLWFVFNQGLSTGEAFAVDAFLNEVSDDTPIEQAQNYSFYGFILMTAYQLVTVGLLFLARDNLKRTKYENDCMLGAEDLRRSLSGKAVMSAIGGACVMFEDHSESQIEEQK